MTNDNRTTTTPQALATTAKAVPAPNHSPARLPRVSICGVPFTAANERTLVARVMEELDAGRGGWIVTANLDFLRRLTTQPEFAALCARATHIVADGMPIVWASRLQGTPVPERVAGSDLVSSLSAAAAARGHSIYLLGGAPGTAERAAAILRRRSPALQIAGIESPMLDPERDHRTVRAIAERICRARPGIIYVAFGSPKQEIFIDRVRHRLPGAWWMGVGISFSYLCGHVRRAPRWMRRLGLEWLYRLAQEPRRLAKRYLLQDFPFLGLLVARTASKAALRHRAKLSEVH